MNKLIETYSEYFGLNEAVFSRIDHNDMMVAVVYRVELSSGKSLILKICTRNKDFYRELYFLNVLEGFLPVPKVLIVAEPTDNRAGAILMEYLEGFILNESDWTHDLAYEVGKKISTASLKTY